MTVTLRPMPPDRLPEWIRRSADEVASDLVTLGRPAAEARRVADEGMAESFPAGRPREGHVVADVLDDAGAHVGYLWIGPTTDGDLGEWWVCDLLVDEGRRGQGLGGPKSLRPLEPRD